MENVFMSYSQINGLPQESKLATYMNRQNVTTPVIKNTLADSLGNMTLDHDGVLLVNQHRRDLTTPTSLRSVGLNGESPSALTGQTPPPVRESPIGTSLLADSLVQPVPRYRYQVNQENVGGTTYFYPTGPGGDSPPTAVSGFQGYASQMTAAQDESTTANSSVRKSFRIDIMEKNALLSLPPDPATYPDLPAEVNCYTELVPLEPIPNTDALTIGQSSTYKATHSKTGVRCCLRRIHGFRISSSKSLVLVEMWKKLSHVNVVQLREVFTSKAFGDNSIVLVYDYHPGSTTLWTKHFSTFDSTAPAPFSTDPNAPAPYSHTKNALLRHQHSSMLPENLIWNYIIQLTAAVRVIHSAGLACRTLQPTKVIVSSRNRLRLSFMGMTDVLTVDPSVANPLSLIPHYQQEDLTALGKLVLALSCRSHLGVQPENIQTTLELVGRTYSADLKNLIAYLLSQGRRTVTDLMPMIGARFYVQLETVQSSADEVEEELAKELDNSRLLRLLTKLGTINERPELSMDTTWSETGDRYMLKLFRDYLFHQVTEDGRPWLDMAHIVQCLNKLDSASPEKICLMSRDEQSILVVTYEELKHCLEQSYDDLVAAATDKNSTL